MCTIHDDDETKAWFYPALAQTLRPKNDAQAEAFVAHLDSPGRVIIEIEPTLRIGFDSEHMFKDSAVGPTPQASDQ